MSLTKSALTKIQCNAISIAIDYKWIVIGHQDPVPLPITVEKNTVIPTDIGTVCCTQVPTNLKSTPERLCLTQTMLSKVNVATVDKCPLKIPSQKKRLRENTISPLEQTITPIFYTEEEVLWVPNGYHNGSQGDTIITTISKI